MQEVKKKENIRMEKNLVVLINKSTEILSRNRIITVSTPGMATANALHTKPGTAPRAVHFNGLAHIVRTGGIKPAGRWQKGGHS